MKKVILAILSLFVINASMLALPSYASTAVTEDACKGHEEEFPDLCKKGTEADMMKVVGNVLNAVYGLVGIIAVVFVIIGGFKYTTSQGDPGKVQQAKNTIMFALIGLVVSVSAFAITSFILGALKG